MTASEGDLSCLCPACAVEADADRLSEVLRARPSPLLCERHERQRERRAEYRAQIERLTPMQRAAMLAELLAWAGSVKP